MEVIGIIKRKLSKKEPKNPKAKAIIIINKKRKIEKGTQIIDKPIIASAAGITKFKDLAIFLEKETRNKKQRDRLGLIEATSNKWKVCKKKSTLITVAGHIHF
ncbi:MAG: hypothetical protein ABEI53_00275 [Candidatus Magasanikbacteria bacterium]